MCLSKFPSSQMTEPIAMSTSKSTPQPRSELDLSTARTYALIETDPNGFEQIIDLLRQFFPRTNILESNRRHSTAQSQANETEDPLSTPMFKGKVKDYLQRRYLDQIDKHRDLSQVNSFDLASSSTGKVSCSFKSYSFDSPSHRNSIERYRSIDIDESSNETNKEHFHDEEINPSLTPTIKSEKRTSVSSTRMSVPSTPYSASSDPGPVRSPWLHTPTSTFNFPFPLNQDPLSVNAQSSITQLSTLTKMLCDEPSVFTPVSPRFQLEQSEGLNCRESSSSVLSCQICRQEFDSHQMYLLHYRTHWDNSCDCPTADIHCDRTVDMRQYSCEICSKRFSRSDMLNRHLRAHSGIRPYRCPMCNTHFSRSDHLSTHLRTHTGEKPYTCSQCSYTACRRDMITRHLKMHRKHRSERKNATATFHSTND